jgi:sulfite exporter TauE/SafE
VTLWGVFLTGLVAGGVSCAAVQGGLLAGLIARRKGIPETSIRRGGRPKAKAKVAVSPAFSGPQDLVPVAGFLAGKLISHMLLGALLGLVGDRVQLNFRVQAIMLISAGAVMLLMALDLLGVRAVRRLVPSPPASWSSLVRRRARSSAAFAPAALGFATVLIPCGVTLSMELLAIASRSALAGALIMGTFVLGTSPLFAILGYTLRRASSVLGSNVGKLAAVAVLIIGTITINNGLALTGSSLSFSGIGSRLVRAQEPEVVQFGPAEIAESSQVADGMQTVTVQVEDTGYSPSRVQAKAGVPTKLVLRTNGTIGCTRAFVIPDLGIQKMLPASGTTELHLGTLPRGRLDFTCSMGMYWGEIDAA